MVDRETLYIINDAIVKIEDKDINYTENVTWQRLRKVQDEAFKEFAQQELERYKSKSKINTGIDYSRKIEEYEEYLNIMEGRNGGREDNRFTNK